MNAHDTKKALEAAGTIAGEEMALSDDSLDLAGHNWGKWNEARKAGRKGGTKNVAQPAGRAKDADKLGDGIRRTPRRTGRPGHDPHRGMIREEVRRATGVDTSGMQLIPSFLQAGTRPAWMGNRTQEKVHRDAVVAETDTISNEWNNAKASGNRAAMVQTAQRLQAAMEREFNAEAAEDPITGPMTNSAASKLTGWGGITIITRNCIAKAMRAVDDDKPGYGGDPKRLARRVQSGLEEARNLAAQGEAKKAAGEMVSAVAYRRALREALMVRGAQTQRGRPGGGAAAVVAPVTPTAPAPAPVAPRPSTDRPGTWADWLAKQNHSRIPLKDEINLAMKEFNLANGFEKNEQGELVPVVPDPWTQEDNDEMEARHDAKLAAEDAKLGGQSGAPHDSKPNGI